MVTKRIWLNKIGVFEILPNPGEGDCLFRAIAQGLGHPTEYQRIREAVVNHLSKTKSKASKLLWKSMRPSILKFWKYSHKFPLEQLKQIESEMSTCCGLRKPDNFKKIYNKIMSQAGEPGTVYELRAAAHLFNFHYDFLQNVTNISDSVDNGNRLGGKMYQFCSCRNNKCRVPREDLESRLLYLLHTKYSAFEGHWELLKPIYLGSIPVPICRRIYGIKYKCPSKNAFNEEYRGPDDLFALQMEALVKCNPKIVPQEDPDPDWPSYDDNFSGCLSYLQWNNL